MLVIAGTIPIKPEKRQEAQQLARVLETETRKEPGCLMYTFYADQTDPNLFFIFEEWDSEEALQKHFQTEHMKKFMQQAPSLLAGKLSAKKYTVSAAAPL
ncbi:MAG: antibiotic biosynthesis monooxygenase [Deltaproteobacteria bacterium]|nr:antibiotic biosynthesis monooxygenase [Deltaproteobacteria bacterium]